MFPLITGVIVVMRGFFFFGICTGFFVETCDVFSFGTSDGQSCIGIAVFGAYRCFYMGRKRKKS